MVKILRKIGLRNWFGLEFLTSWKLELFIWPLVFRKSRMNLMTLSEDVFWWVSMRMRWLRKHIAKVKEVEGEEIACLELRSHLEILLPALLIATGASLVSDVGIGLELFPPNKETIRRLRDAYAFSVVGKELLWRIDREEEIRKLLEFMAKASIFECRVLTATIKRKNYVLGKSFIMENEEKVIAGASIAAFGYGFIEYVKTYVGLPNCVTSPIMDDQSYFYEEVEKKYFNLVNYCEFAYAPKNSVLTEDPPVKEELKERERKLLQRVRRILDSIQIK